MARTKISEYSTTAGNNTDINSINLAEGCAPSGINDAIRELMRQLKEFQTGGAGDSVNSGGDFSVATNKFTVASASGNTSVAGTLGVTGAATLSSTLAVTGTTTLTGALVANGNATLGDASGDTVTIKGTPTLEVNPTLSGGTANGVLYLNGSKVATSGSALTFDGTTLLSNAGFSTGIAGGGSYKLNYASNVDSRSWRVINDQNVYGDFAIQQSTTQTGSTYRAIYSALNDGTQFWSVAGSEAMRLTGTGLGIGTSSPGAKLDVRGNIVGGNGTIQTAVTYDSIGAIGTLSNHGLRILTNSNGVAVFDTSGNLGLGVTPSAWNSVYRSMQLGKGASVSGRSDENTWCEILSNAYRASDASWKYLNTDYALAYRLAAGSHQWYTAASGTAGDAITFTQAATLTAAGDFLVGTTSVLGGGKFSVQGAAGGNIAGFQNGDDAGRGIAFLNSSGTVVGSITWNATVTTYAVTSDQRLKENISDADSASSLIDALQVRKFDWKANGSHQRYGFVAQELVTVAPEAVHQPTDPEQMMAVDYSKLVPMLVKEIQSLRARVAALES